MENVGTGNTAEIKKSIKNFIVDNFLFGVENEALTDEASFLESGIIDSTGILELITFVENEYKIKISDAEMIPKNLDSLDNISSFVSSKLS